MPLLRPLPLRLPQARLRASLPLPLPLQQQRAFNNSPALRGGDSHGGSQYDAPTGWLFGVPPGQKYEKEGWEGIFFYLFCGGLIAGGVGWAFKPDSSIQTWALEEARRRLEAEGILEDPESK